ncbi:hypothetical protein [Streptomyces mirabilis]|uniref:Uncharacterized protein n=1 Tax=Streptomyces mirabilis TaxID=68239 RepID=A0ABU3URR2_9ACTN|nr:hypothetical protein [Streptomyces mirabilis]MDU8996425.1 hypothetical protein [Streptomyces mirabilis]
MARVTVVPDELIKLERSAEDEREKLTGFEGEAYDVQWKVWRAAAEDFQAVVTEYAAREGVGMSWHEVEQASKRAVRPPAPEG